MLVLDFDYFISRYFNWLLSSAGNANAIISNITYAAKRPISIDASDFGMTVVKICSTYIHIYKSMKSTHFYLT